MACFYTKKLWVSSCRQAPIVNGVKLTAFNLPLPWCNGDERVARWTLSCRPDQQARYSNSTARHNTRTWTMPTTS